MALVWLVCCALCFMLSYKLIIFSKYKNTWSSAIPAWVAMTATPCFGILAIRDLWVTL